MKQESARNVGGDIVFRWLAYIDPQQWPVPSNKGSFEDHAKVLQKIESH